MAKKKAETKKTQSAAGSKAKLARRGGVKRSKPQVAEAKSDGRPRSKKDEVVLPPPQESGDEQSAITPIVASPEAPPPPNVDVESEDRADGNAGARVQSAGVEATDPRLPKVPTTLVRRNRHGVVQCECTVGPEGIFYNGQRYRSLSGAASAASKDLGLNPVVNGYVFFHLAKPARARLGEVERLRRLGHRYEEQLAAVLMARPGEVPDVGVKDEIEAHRQRIEKILTVTAQ